MKIIFVDIETTGTDFDIHVPIEICLTIIDPEGGGGAIDSYTSLIRCRDKDLKFSDEEALCVNGLMNESAFFHKTIDDISEEVQDFLIDNKISEKNAVFLCQNPSFDRPFFHKILSQRSMTELNMPYRWLDLASMYMAYHHKEFKKLPFPEILSKDKIARNLGLPPESKPHRAENGVIHLMLCFNEILRKSYL